MAQKKKTVPRKIVLPRINDDGQTEKKDPPTPREILAAKCLDPLDVIEILKISMGTFNNWFNAELMPLIKINKRRYVDLDDFVILLNSMKQWGKGKGK